MQWSYWTTTLLTHDQNRWPAHIGLGRVISFNKFISALSLSSEHIRCCLNSYRQAIVQWYDENSSSLLLSAKMLKSLYKPFYNYFSFNALKSRSKTWNFIKAFLLKLNGGKREEFSHKISFCRTIVQIQTVWRK
jgi:hypothetical protein